MQTVFISKNVAKAYQRGVLPIVTSIEWVNRVYCRFDNVAVSLTDCDWNKAHQVHGSLFLGTRSCMVLVCTYWIRLVLVLGQRKSRRAYAVLSQPWQLSWLQAYRPVSNSYVLSAKQQRSRTSNFNVFCLTRPGIELLQLSPATTALPGCGNFYCATNTYYGMR